MIPPYRSIFFKFLLRTYIVANPTSPFTILEPRDQEIGEFYVAEERRATDFEAQKLCKCLSGNSELPQKEDNVSSILQNARRQLRFHCFREKKEG